MTIVFKASDNIKEKMIKHYADRRKEKTPPYAIFQAQDYDVIVTLYESGKIMFQGIGADIEATIWTEEERILNNRCIDINSKEKKKEEKNELTYFNINTIGSDEVGTGDYFGPIVVSSSFVSVENMPLLIDLGVKDSKKMTDSKIIEIAPTLIKEIPHSSIILDNDTYNKNYSAEINMNRIKAILHNKVLLSLLKKDNWNYEKIIVDQFVYPKKYYEHLKDVPQKVTNITFTTKAENKCFSVAVASIISRYLFLKEMKNLSDALGITLPKGAGEIVDESGKVIVAKFGFDKLSTIAKLNFKNTEKIKEEI